MRNGSGDHWFALICQAGIALVGLAHEARNFRPGRRNPQIFEGLPKDFHDNLLGEPAFEAADSTFCLWRRRRDTRWYRGPVERDDGEDGTSELLGILMGNPADYVSFAREYYEREVDVAAVAAVYRHEPLTDALIHALNPDVTLESLREDLNEIRYP